MPPQLLRQIQIIWAALIIGVVLFLGVAIFVGPNIGAAEDFPLDLYMGLTALVSIVAIVIGFGIQHRMRSGRFFGQPLPQGMATDFVLSFAPLEASAMLAVVGYLLTQQAVLLAFLVPFFAFAVLFFPSRVRLDALAEAAEAARPR
jgi:hypothetical protein